MKSRRETIVLIVIVVGSLMLGSAITPLILRDSESKRKQGDPNDVSSLVPRQALLSETALRRGAESPKFTLVEFGDYQCASCGRAESTLRELLENRKDLAVLFRHYPLTSEHANAERAAYAAEVARDMGKGQEMHDALYERQDEWANEEDIRPHLIEIASGVGLDKSAFASALSGNQAIRERIQADQRVAEACSVQITPSFFLVTPSRIWAAIGPIGLERLISDDKYWQ